MLKVSVSASLLLMGGLVCGSSQSAYAQNATLTVYMRAAGSGALDNTSSISTQVQVYAVSSVAAKYNGSTNLYAPSVRTLPGTSFSQAIPNLYSPVLAPGNSYQVQLNWTDNASKQLLLGPVTLNPGANNLGAGGIGTTTPIDVVNDPPPAARNLSCYADLPDKSTQLYVYWSGVLLANAKDLDRTELHMSTSPTFVPSAATLVATPPYGTDYRKLTGLKPATDYYFCVRVLDRYGAFTDACRTIACTTAMASSSGGDGGTAGDGGSMATDDAGSGGTGTDDAGTGGPAADDAGNGNEGPIIDGGSIAVGCGCSLATTTQSGAFLSILPAVMLFLRRRRRSLNPKDALPRLPSCR